MTDIKEIAQKLPKAELHCHLDGSVRPETILALAKKRGAKLPTEDVKELKKYVCVPPSCRSLAEFLACFNFFYDFLKDPEAVERISYELVEDVSRENVRILEVRFAPPLQEVPGKFSADEVVKSALAGLMRGEKDFPGVKTGAILCFYRSLTEKQNDATLTALKKYFGHGVIGADLAGDESGYPFAIYEKYFRVACDMGVPFTAHAGEAAGPESIKAAIDAGARRIGHGTRLREDKNLLRRVTKERIPLEICLTSNVQTQTVKDYSYHPIAEYFEDNVNITLNTDDRSISDIDLTHEIIIAKEMYGFSVSEILEIIKNGFEASFLDEKTRKEITDKSIKEMMTLCPEHSK